MVFKVNFFPETPSPFPAIFFRKIINKSAKILGGRKKGEISLILADEKFIRRLNKKYRKKNKSASILTFVFFENNKFINFQDPRLLGEIIICPDKARKEARQEGVAFRDKIILLIIHGLLHIIGYTHQNQKQRKKMEAKEEELLSGLSL
ncbi:MAG: rRNA maturation RNase YbeY [Patescibacteria group bacterium]